MTNPAAPQTKLDAVNLMLASIGQTPINTLDVVGIKDAAIARLALDRETRNVLGRGWSFNTDHEYTLAKDEANHFPVPATALWMAPSDRWDAVVVRWTGDPSVPKLYNRDRHTFEFSQDSMKVDVIWSFDFEEIPEVARNYIATKAARVFQSQVIGSELLFRFTAGHEEEAYATLLRQEGKTKRTNMLASGAGTNLIYQRHRNPSKFG